MKYKRVLLKLSGEQFASSAGTGIDSDFINNLASDLKALVAQNGVELAVVIGGGNFVRGKDVKVKGLKEETAHYMGMVSTILNGLALADVLASQGQPAYLQSKLATKVADDFNPEAAVERLQNGEVLIILGGTGRPFVTTDSGAVEAAVALKCQLVLKATKVDGVYDKDPVQNPDAKKYTSLSYDQAYDNPQITVMDKEAVDLARQSGLPIIVCKLSGENLIKAVQGEDIGTKIGG